MSTYVQSSLQSLVDPVIKSDKLPREASVKPSTQPAPSPDELWNFRDIGGLRTLDNRIVRPGLIYRSGNLDRVSPAGFQILRDKFHVRYVFDLRSSDEGSASDGWITSRDGVPIHHVVAMNWTSSRDPVQEHFSLLSQDLTAAFMVIYKHLTVESGPAFAKIFAHIRDNPGACLVVHCDLGKDRTGMFIALLLQVLGVADEDIAADYHLSEQYMDAVIASKTEKFRRSPIFTLPEQGIQGHFSAPTEVMKAFLQYIQEAYGSGEGYLHYLGFPSEDINRIRENMLVSRL